MADVATDTTAASPPPPNAPADLTGADDILSPDARKSLTTQLEKIERQKIGAEGALIAQEDRQNKAYRERMDKMVQEEGATAAEAKPWNAQQELSSRQTSLWDQFGSPGFIVAMLGSAFTARPMNSALQAGASAMNAINQNNMKDYDKAFEAWKENTDLVLKRLNTEHEQFEDIDKLRQTDIAEWQAKMRSALARFDDQRGLALMDAGLFPELDEKIAGVARSRELIAQSKTAIEENDLRRRLVNSFLPNKQDWTDPQKVVQATQRAEDLISATKTPGTPEQQLWNEYKAKNPNASLDDQLKFYQGLRSAPYMRGGGPDIVEGIVHGIITGEQPPQLTGLYGASAAVRAALDKQGFNLAKAQIEWEAARKQVQSLNGPQMTRFVGLARSVVNTIDEAEDLASQMRLSGVTALNKAELETFIHAQGNTENGKLAARYLGAVNTLKEEFANLASGGYAPHEAAWDLANRQINENYGVDELNASLVEIQRLINYRIQSIPGLGNYGPGADNKYLGGGQTAQPGQSAQPSNNDGWTTLPNGNRIREVQ